MGKAVSFDITNSVDPDHAATAAQCLIWLHCLPLVGVNRSLSPTTANSADTDQMLRRRHGG